MRSIADVLRRESAARLEGMTANERLELAFELADADVRLLMSARGVSAEEAERTFERARRHGRTPSGAASR